MIIHAVSVRRLTIAGISRQLEGIPLESFLSKDQVSRPQWVKFRLSTALAHPLLPPQHCWESAADYQLCRALGFYQTPHIDPRIPGFSLVYTPFLTSGNARLCGWQTTRLMKKPIMFYFGGNWYSWWVSQTQYIQMCGCAHITRCTPILIA